MTTTTTGPVTSVSAESALLGPDSEGADGQAGTGLECTVDQAALLLSVDQIGVSTSAPGTTEVLSDSAAVQGGQATVEHGTVTSQPVRFVFFLGRVSRLY